MRFIVLGLFIFVLAGCSHKVCNKCDPGGTIRDKWWTNPYYKFTNVEMVYGDQVLVVPRQVKVPGEFIIMACVNVDEGQNCNIYTLPFRQWAFLNIGDYYAP